MAHVNEDHTVLPATIQFYLPPTRLSTSEMNHTSLLPAAEGHNTLAGTNFPSYEGKRLS